MVSPDQVESGRACNCCCPGCGAPLIAKQGERNAWHFAHDGPLCGDGAETALHMMAKQILADEKRVQLPAVEVRISATDVLGELQTASNILVGAQDVQYQVVELEVTKDNRRPDAVASGGTAKLEHRIEVFVRHAVDSVKATELINQECVCFEICLDDVPIQTPMAELREAVVASRHRVRWISYPGMAAARRVLEQKLRALLNEAELRKIKQDAHLAEVYACIAEEDRREKAEWARQASEKKKWELKVARAHAAFKSASTKEKRAFLQAKLRLPEGPTPALLNRRVSGDASFGVARDVWQADVFRKYIFGGGRREIALESILSWLRLRYVIAHEFPNAANIALWKYLSFLEVGGFVRHLGRQRFEVLRDVAPWLEAAVRVSGCWFWSPGAYSCGFSELKHANTRGEFGLPDSTLAAILRQLNVEHGANGQPEDVALSVAQRIEVCPTVVLSLLAAAGAVSNPREQEIERARTGF